MKPSLVAFSVLMLMARIAQAQEADLELIKSADRQQIEVGQPIVWTLQAINNGPDGDSDVVITDTLPAEVSLTQMDVRCAPDPLDALKVECRLPMAPGQMESMTITATLNSVPPMNSIAYISGIHLRSGLPGVFSVSTLSGHFDFAESFNPPVSPRGVFLKSDGLQLLADRGDPTLIAGTPVIDGAIIEIDPDPLVNLPTIISQQGLLVNPNDVLLGADGMIYVADINGIRLDGLGQPLPDMRGRIIQIDPNLGIQNIVSEGGLVDSPSGLIWTNGNLAVADAFGLVYLIDPSSGAQTLLSQGGLLLSPQALTIVGSRLIVADSQSGLVEIDLANGNQQSLLTAGPATFGPLVLPVDIDYFSDGLLYVLDAGLSGLWQVEPVTGTTQSFYQPETIDLLAGLDMAEGPPQLVNKATIASNSGDTFDTNNDNDMFSTSTTVIPPPPAVQLSVSELITVSDMVLILPAAILNVSEEITVGDSVVVSPSLLLDVSELVIVSDSVQVSPAILLSITELITVTDGVQVRPSVLLDIAELITVTDSVQVLSAIQLNITEGILVSDAVVLTPSLMLMIQESITVLDTPIRILIAPRVTLAKPVAGLCQNEITPGARLPAAITELQLTFSLPMQDPAGDTEMIDVTNPMSYRLVSSISPNTPLPATCITPLPVNTTEQPVVLRAYDAASQTVVLGTALNTGLERLYYRLMACNEGLESTFGVPLDGNGNGSSGGDFAINFSVAAQNYLANPNFSDGISLWTPDGVVAADSADADNATFAGSSRADASAVGAAVGQCIDLSGQTTMRLGASMLSELPTGDGSLRIDFYAAAQCQGNNLATANGIKAANDSSWTNTWLDANVPATATSAMASVIGDVAAGSPIYVDRTYFISSPNIFVSGFEPGESSACAVSGGAVDGG